jgi:hypothetical protein
MFVSHIFCSAALVLAGTAPVIGAGEAAAYAAGVKLDHQKIFALVLSASGVALVANVSLALRPGARSRARIGNRRYRDHYRRGYRESAGVRQVPPKLSCGSKTIKQVAQA